MKVVAVMPVYNEEKHVGRVIRETRKYVDEVVAVDDGSRDKSYLKAEKAGARALKHIINMGLGFTLRTGAEKAVKDGADIIITIDSDGQHDPAEIPKLVRELKKNKLDVVIGFRPPDKNMPFTKKLGNWIIYKASKTFFGVDIKDTQSGFRVLTRKAFEKIKWDSARYAVSSEIVMRIGKQKLKYKEVPIKTIYGDKYKGTNVIDGLKIFISMLWWKMTRA
jgi:glycosyltransferase involved in cell wall biosynthesis